MPPDDESAYAVGYGKPPRHSRFEPGQSGNPRGRPPGSKNLSSLLKKALDEPVIVVETVGGVGSPSAKPSSSSSSINRRKAI